VARFTPRPFYHRLGRLQRLSGSCGEDKNILPLPAARRPPLGRVSYRGLLFGKRYSGHSRREASSCRQSLKDTTRLILTGMLLRF
jgi:hypothetical protein